MGRFVVHGISSMVKRVSPAPILQLACCLGGTSPVSRLGLMRFSRHSMDLVDASGVAARMEDTGSPSAVASEVSGHVGDCQARPRQQDPCCAEATGSKLHVRLSIAWRGAIAPINNGSPNSEMALTHYFQIFKSTDAFGRRQ